MTADRESQESNLKPLAFERKSVEDVFLSTKSTLKVCAPMVRYSKLAFRTLVREYGCDLAFTPMIVADAFVNSVRARDSEFTTSVGDHPLVVQFAANDATVLANAAELVAAHSDGIDLNCGCPQRWALSECLGAHLINEPQLVRDMVLQTRNRITEPSKFSTSVKIRLHQDIRRTVDLCQQAENAGASFITVHGRTVEQRTEPVDYDAICTIRKSIAIPIIANGDIRSVEDVERVHSTTGVQGVMAARGLLQNPAMFLGFSSTPPDCIGKWLGIAIATGTPFTYLHHHLVYMTSRLMSGSDRRSFTALTSSSAVLDFLEDNYDIRPIVKSR